ncbi:response regulator [Glycomyces xiaoerkulensis]|uniref:response regulator n=1 Tax=Glycomyces xiaoerkulensis TaxID=2038139 RepID=UPI000C264B51|nr:response regulator [Glycomyces xiaoerkulensis]
MIRLAAVDDDRMLTGALGTWSAERADMRLVAAAETVEPLLRRGTGDIDVVLLDLLLADRSDPAENVRRLAAAGPQVVIVSVVAEPGEVMTAYTAGASGYVAKSNDLSELAGAVRRIAAGDEVCRPELAFAMAHDQRPERPRLAARERQLLVNYASGMTLEAAARRIGIRPSTAKCYLERVKEKYRRVGRPTYTKLDLADRAREDGLAR